MHIQYPFPWLNFDVRGPKEAHGGVELPSPGGECRIVRQTDGLGSLVVCLFVCLALGYNVGRPSYEVYKWNILEPLVIGVIHEFG